MKGLALPGYWSRAAVIAAALCLPAGPWAHAQESKGENFSAKPAPALFASDCTGSECHKGPQGLAKTRSVGSLAGFLREHYTNSRESAAALAAYLIKVPAGPAPREARPARAPVSREASPARPQREHPSARTSRTLAKPEEEGTAAQPPHRAAEPPAAATPARNARAQRARPQPAAEPPPPAEPAPPAEAAPKQQFDIFD